MTIDKLHELLRRALDALIEAHTVKEHRQDEITRAILINDIHEYLKNLDSQNE